MTWPQTKESLRRITPETRERKLLKAFRQLPLDGQVIVTAYCEECVDASRQRAARAAKTRRPRR